MELRQDPRKKNAKLLNAFSLKARGVPRKPLSASHHRSWSWLKSLKQTRRDLVYHTRLECLGRNREASLLISWPVVARLARWLPWWNLQECVLEPRVVLNVVKNSRHVQSPLVTDCSCISTKITKQLSEYIWLRACFHYTEKFGLVFAKKLKIL